MNVVLIGTYELGRQPFGLASPAAWLRRAGADVTCLDLSREEFSEGVVRAADLVAFHVPMHTATRLAVPLVETVRQLNPRAHICFYGLYAPMNEAYLRKLGAETILGGEFEQGLLHLVEQLSSGEPLRAALCHSERSPVSGLRWSPPDSRNRSEESAFALAMEKTTADSSPRSIGARNDKGAAYGQSEPVISLARQGFAVPDRTGLAPLERYAHLILPSGDHRTAGYTEASRGCKHFCRHCPIVPVYNGAFRIVQRDIVLADVRQQVAAGARHITFGDPDFFNGPTHAMAIVRAVHEEFPEVTYDVTTKIEHLLKHSEHLATLRDTGCLFVTSAVESVDDTILERLAKGHTRADFLRAVGLCREVGLTLQPTFVPFTPWTTLGGYRDLLHVLAENDLVEAVAPIQLSIRLLIPAGSRLLELSAVRELVGPFDDAALVYPWRHPDPRVDALCEEVQEIVGRSEELKRPRARVFECIWQAAQTAGGKGADEPLWQPPVLVSRAAVPYLNEPWYC